MLTQSNCRISDLEFDADSLDVHAASDAYQKFGAIVIRGATRQYADQVRRDIEASVAKAYQQYDRAAKVPDGWTTPDGTLWLPAPHRKDGKDKQVMVSSCNYLTSASLFRSAFDDVLCDMAEAVLGPNVELFLRGQCLVKEPVGGHAKNLHQDAGYFEHRFEGPMAVLSYAVDTNLDKGALHVVPGSHRLGMLDHVDTDSHLGLDPEQWTFDKALPIEGKAGDAILFHVKTIHGSKHNITDSPRPVFIHRYRSANDYVVISATNKSSREQAAAHAEEAKKENQLGYMVRGFRPWSDEQIEG